jgi:hypothetical protein
MYPFIQSSQDWGSLEVICVQGRIMLGFEGSLFPLNKI